MIWPHLETSKLDERFQIVSEQISPFINHGVVYDLNCGRAGLVDYLPDDTGLYIGNDISPELLGLTKLHDRFPIILMRMPDNLVQHHIPRSISKIGILTLFGAVVGTPPMESRDQDMVHSWLVKKYSPHTLVIEACRAYKEKQLLLESYKERYSDYKVYFEGQIQAKEITNPDVDIRHILILRQ